MASSYSADVVIVGTGAVGCTVAEQALDAGLLMLEAAPRAERWQNRREFSESPAVSQEGRAFRTRPVRQSRGRRNSNPTRPRRRRIIFNLRGQTRSPIGRVTCVTPASRRRRVPFHTSGGAAWHPAAPLSLQIEQLEEAMGAKLFWRLSRGIELTDAGGRSSWP
jgi:choline dehydrogenase-like flavoprotein